MCMGDIHLHGHPTRKVRVFLAWDLIKGRQVDHTHRHGPYVPMYVDRCLIRCP